MNYVISDLHGCYDDFLQMLELINLSEEDNLFIIGDVVDRGAASVKLLQYLMKHSNMRLLLGNHDWFMMTVLNKLPIDVTADNFKEYLNGSAGFFNVYTNWIYNGGGPTLNEYFDLSVPEITDILNFLNSLLYYYELTVENQDYILVHSVPGGYSDSFDKKKPLPDYELFDLIFSRIDDDKWGEYYYDDKILIVGHTPTLIIDKEYTGKIYKREKIINIDCGCVFKYRNEDTKLGCLRLEDMKEYYV